jgi:hypothetical protein
MPGSGYDQPSGGGFTTSDESALASTEAAEAADAANIAAIIQKRTLRIQGSNVAAGGGTASFNIGAALPAAAVVLGHEVKLDTQFSGGSLSDMKIVLGGTDTAALINAFSVKTSTAGGKRYSPGYSAAAGNHCAGSFSAQQLVATFTPTGDTLNHVAAGDLTITVWFIVLA